MKYDLIDLPGELADLPDCGACYDNGYIDEDETVFCDCDAGEHQNALLAELDAQADYEGGLFEDDADALASCGWGTDEDYGGGWDYL